MDTLRDLFDAIPKSYRKIRLNLLMHPLRTYKVKFPQHAQKQIRLLSLFRNIEDMLWSKRINESCSNSGTALIRTALSSLVVTRRQGAAPPLAVSSSSSRQNKNKRKKVLLMFSPRTCIFTLLPVEWTAKGGLFVVKSYEYTSDTSLSLNRPFARNNHMVVGKLIIIPTLGHQKKGKSSFTGSGLFVLMSQCGNNNELAHHHVPCDRLLQKAYSFLCHIGWIRTVISSNYFRRGKEISESLLDKSDEQVTKAATRLRHLFLFHPTVVLIFYLSGNPSLFNTKLKPPLEELTTIHIIV